MASYPWLYPYEEDAKSTRLGQPIFRPFVPISFAADDEMPLVHRGLIDTGADAILASDLVAERLGLDLDDHDGETTHDIGGRMLVARYKTVSLRLLDRYSEPDCLMEWEKAFDERFGIVPAC